MLRVTPDPGVPRASRVEPEVPEIKGAKGPPEIKAPRVIKVKPDPQVRAERREAPVSRGCNGYLARWNGVCGD